MPIVLAVGSAARIRLLPVSLTERTPGLVTSADGWREKGESAYNPTMPALSPDEVLRYLNAKGFLSSAEVELVKTRWNVERDGPLLQWIGKQKLLPEEVAADIIQLLADNRLEGLEPSLPGLVLLALAGKGGRGSVYRAWQPSLKRVVAVKILSKELAQNREYLQRFLREAKVASKVSHKNIVRAFDINKHGGNVYLVMEYVAGASVGDILRQRGKVEPAHAMEIAQNVAEAIAYVSQVGIVHRDIKPDNIMVTRERVAKLLDLGLAKMRVEGDVGQSKGMAVGTPNYISPEQAMGRSDIDTRADIYSLGVTLFFVLTGRVPFEGPPEVVMYRHIHEPPPHPKNFRPDLSDSVCTLMFTMMAKRPEDRPASAGQVVSDIEHLLRTGKLPGLFDSGAPAAPLRVNKSGGALVVKKRLPNLHGYGMPGAHTNLPPSPPPSDDPNAPRLPRKRRKHFGSGW